MKIKHFFTIAMTFAFALATLAQNVAINADGSQPDSRVILDVSSNSKGVLLPRLTEAQRDALAEDVPEGMIIFNTTSKEFQVFIADSWYALSMLPASKVPNAVCNAASNITLSTATLNGLVNPNNAATTVTFEYGLTTEYGSTATATQSPITGNTNKVVSAGISGLTFNTTYHCRIKAENISGTTYSDDITFTTSSDLAIGSSYAGGIVFYIDGTGQHGLVCATSDVSSNATWGCNGVAISGTSGTGVGNGAQNTLNIVNACSTAGIAARLCSDLELNGFNDWYLPTVGECQLIRQNLYLQSLGNLSGEYYWTSSQIDGNMVWGFGFPDGDTFDFMKIHGLRVRAIRSF